jgi:hypothetical protein
MLSRRSRVSMLGMFYMPTPLCGEGMPPDATVNVLSSAFFSFAFAGSR